jgi:large subunit ribosomal protein L21
MYAIVEIAGQQFKVEEGKKIFVHRLEVDDSENIEFDKVLLIEDDGKIIIGEPTIKDAIVEGKILEQVRGDKVIVFKKKRKKGYRIRNGHRQYFTQVEIVSINEKASPKKAASKKVEVPKAEPKAEVKEQAETKVAEKKSAVKKAEPKKVGEKSTPVKKITTKKAAEKPLVKKATGKKATAKNSSKGKTE